MGLLYRQVYESLRDDIRGSVFAVGGKLPLEIELANRFSVSRITIKHALNLLRADGYITRRPRVGTVVVSANPSPVPDSRGVSRPIIGLVTTSFDDAFGTRVLEGVLDAADLDAHVIVKRSRGSVEDEGEAIRSLLDAGVLGLILLPSSSHFIPPAALELVTRQYPVVILDRSYYGIPVSAVFSDNFLSSKMATEYLFDLGHEHVGFIASASAVSTNDERENGYVRAHATRHIPLKPSSELKTIQSTLPGVAACADEDIDRLVEFISARSDLTAYVVTEYNIALMLHEACRRIGLHVPDDVSIICFDHPVAFPDRGLFRFTHIAQDQLGLGRRAVQQVLAQIRDRNGIEKTVVPSSLVPGQSTRVWHPNLGPSRA